MKQRKMTAIAVVCGIVCALCLVAFMMSVQNQAEAARNEALARYGGEQVEVCVATRDIAAGERIGYDALETKMWVAGLLPDGAVRDSGEVMGQVVTSSILKGEVLASKRFEENHDTLEVPDGKQAVSVPVKAVQAVGGSIQPGMRVNVYSTGDAATAILASDVMVLATSMGESGAFSSAESGWVTLAVDPERVQEVIAASNKTNLHLAIPGETSKGEKDHE